MTYAVIIAAILVILAGIHEARSILGPFLMATFFAVLLLPPMNWIKKKGFSTGFSLAVVIIVVVFFGLAGTTIIGSQIAQFAKELPRYRDDFNDKLRKNNIGIEEFLPAFLRSDPDKEVDSENTDEEPVESEDAPNSAKESAPDTPSPLPTSNDPSLNKAKVVPLETPLETDAADAQSALSPLPESLTSVAYVERMDSASGSRDGAEPDAVVEGESGLETIDGAEGETKNVVVKGGTRSIAAIDDNRPSLNLSTPPDQFLSGAESALHDPDSDGAVSDTDNGGDDASVPKIHTRITAVDASSQSLFQFLGGLAGELSYLGSTTFIVMLLVVFMLVETASIPGKLEAVLGPSTFKNAHFDKVIDDIRHYMVIKTEMSMIIGLSVVILLTATKVKYPILWGFVAFLLNYIPNIGSVVASLPPIVLAIVDGGWTTGCVVTASLIVINCTVGYAVEPRLLGRGLGLSPLIVLISLIFFGWLLGPVGMFLSPPLAVIMKIIFQAFPETRLIAGLMANKPLPPLERDDESPSLDS
ncbi:MAG: AI-2E family transporter [Thermoguttaceae bacterium]|nr:AI-2E family transporter [Thermoguttaceae bacterium]